MSYLFNYIYIILINFNLAFLSFNNLNFFNFYIKNKRIKNLFKIKNKIYFTFSQSILFYSFSYKQDFKNSLLRLLIYILLGNYIPNAGEGLKRLDYRTNEWDNDYREFVNNLKKKKHVIIGGDLNVAHNEIDIANPKGSNNNLF